jgi:16S rRNA (cytosine967-C5)-methyltransferase
MAAAAPGERVLDLCAAPGGKTMVMLADMSGAGGHGAGLVAADYRRPRVALLAETIARASAAVPIVQLDARQPLPFPAVFDAVLLDAPCSGLGTLRRDPDLKWSRQADDLPRLAGEALAMLRMAATVVRPGGRLIYATCSSEPDENAAVVTAFLESEAGFEPSDAPPPGVPPAAIGPEGWLATTPDRDGLECFFAAVLARRRAA